jgi:hypothetical protein
MFCAKQNVLLIFSILVISTKAASDFSDCVNSESPVACRGMNFLSKALNQIITNNHDETIPLLPGLEIIQNENINTIEHNNDERSMSSEQEPILLRVAKYLQTHDLKIKFSDIIGKTDLQEVVNNVFNSDDPAVNGKEITTFYMIIYRKG